GRGGRILVDEYNRVKGYEDTIFALGDIAMMQTDKYPHGHPQVAQPAIQQAVNLARNLNAGSFTSKFEYYDKGSMATVGKNKAVVDLSKVSFGGTLAWWAWMFIHLISLIGMRNKLNVMLNWIWNYCTYSTSLRLLLRPTKYPMRRHWGD
ncbi:MAG: NAD(P)/FAD-dependent oxidoreductase, partial [Muribaculaceae bacterium]|nr:NAD(P)/FAD-dependent oxidoreductase [Muribaculaceae bacterium]